MSAKQTKDRTVHKDAPTVTDFIAEWMHNNNPAWTIDTLLSRPTDALRLGIDVAARQQKIAPAAARRITRAIAALVKAFPAEIDAIDAVCAAAINARKRGCLKRDKV